MWHRPAVPMTNAESRSGPGQASEKGPQRRRLFFALWPPAAVRVRMARVGRRLPRRRGRPVPMENLHLTLAFVGPVDEETARCLETAAATVQPEPFTLVLDEVGQFRGSRVVWLGAS
ncbi:MAG TPA: RNA 2',3'-cyclic phosphodiesterase, partial [Chromatiales bacterium]|nr:RNA 2',3'-cyclic phosphodiesterase [Chromatiales bacterium]